MRSRDSGEVDDALAGRDPACRRSRRRRRRAARRRASTWGPRVAPPARAGPPDRSRGRRSEAGVDLEQLRAVAVRPSAPAADLVGRDDVEVRVEPVLPPSTAGLNVESLPIDDGAVDRPEASQTYPVVFVEPPSRAASGSEVPTRNHPLDGEAPGRVAETDLAPAVHRVGGARDALRGRRARVAPRFVPVAPALHDLEIVRVERARTVVVSARHPSMSPRSPG